MTRDIFIRAYEKINTFQGKSRFYTWLHRLAVNIIIRKGKTHSERNKKESDFEIEEIYDGVYKVDCSYPGNLKDELIDLERALFSLPEQARIIFIQHEMESFTHEEISNLLGIAAGTSKAHLSRARRLIKKELKI